MKIKIEVELDTVEDKDQIFILQNCNELFDGCVKFANYLRAYRKYDNSLDEQQKQLLEKICDAFNEEVGGYLS